MTEPYRPPWYPYNDNPWDIVDNMSNNIVTRYSLWCNSLPPGELIRLIKEYRESVRLLSRD